MFRASSRSLRVALAFVFVSCGSGGGYAQNGELAFTLKQIAPNVWAAIDNPKAERRRGASNAGVVVGDDGVLVVDAFVTSDAAKQLLGEIGKLTKLPVKYVVNTHSPLSRTADRPPLDRRSTARFCR